MLQYNIGDFVEFLSSDGAIDHGFVIKVHKDGYLTIENLEGLKYSGHSSDVTELLQPAPKD